MRDKGRIKDFLVRLEALWNKYPDLRIGQLLINVAHKTDIFYIEEDEFIKLMDKWEEENERKESN